MSLHPNRHRSTCQRNPERALNDELAAKEGQFENRRSQVVAE